MKSLGWVFRLATAFSLSVLIGCGGIRHGRIEEPPSSQTAMTGPAPSSSATASSGETDGFPQDATRIVHWQEDLHYLATELPNRHPNLFHQLSEEEFRAAVEHLSHDIPTMTDGEIQLALARLVAMAGDDHTSIHPGGFDVHRFPLKFRVFSDGVFVTAAARELDRTLRTRLVKIGDTEADDVIRAVAQFISHENDAWVKERCPAFLNMADALRMTGVISATKHADFAFEDRDGERFEEDISSIPASKMRQVEWVSALENVGTPPPVTNRSGRNYWFRYLDDSRTLYLQYNVCREMPEKPFADFTDDVVASMHADPVDRFILDLRYNHGGSSEIINPLVRAIRENESINRWGRLFVLIGPGTMSSGGDDATKMRKRTRSLLVGEPTGGKPNSYGDIDPLRLPHSRIIVRYSTQYFHYSREDTPSLFPDIPVPVTSGGFFSRTDPVLETVLNLTPQVVEELVRQQNLEDRQRFVADEQAPAGIWTGILEGKNGKWRIVLRFSRDEDGEILGYLELPGLMDSSLQVDRGYFKDNAFYIETDECQGWYFEGETTVDGSSIKGRGIHTSMEEWAPITLAAVSEEDLAEMIQQERPWQPIATDDERLEGTWSGIVTQGRMTARVLFRFERGSKGELLGLVDSFDQSTIGVRLTGGSLEGGHLRVEIDSMDFVFEGDVSEDFSVINGEISQEGQSVELTLNRQ